MPEKIVKNDGNKKKKEIITRYNERSYVEIYDNRYSNLQASKFAFFKSSITQTFLKAQNGIWLDFGCGTGLTWQLIKQVYQELAAKTAIRYIGCDISRGMLRKFAEKSIISENDVFYKPQLICADGEHLPLRSGIIPYTVSLTTLQNLPNPKLGLKEIVHVQQIPGLILVSVLKKSTELQKWMEWMTDALRETRHTIEVLNIHETQNLEDWIFKIQIFEILQ